MVKNPIPFCFHGVNHAWRSLLSLVIVQKRCEAAVNGRTAFRRVVGCVLKLQIQAKLIFFDLAGNTV